MTEKTVEDVVRWLEAIGQRKLIKRFRGISCFFFTDRKTDVCSFQREKSMEMFYSI